MKLQQLFLFLALLVLASVSVFAAAPEMDAIGAQSVTVGETLTFSVSATDSDGDDLTYDASGLPSGATFSSQTFSWAPTNSDIGSTSVTFSVSDGTNSVSEVVSISVEAEDRASEYYAELEALEDDYDSIEDDYEDSRRKYRRAVDENDRDDIERYGDDLEDALDDLDDLRDDVNDLEDDVNDDDDLSREDEEDLEDDLNDLEDDIDDLEDSINFVLNGEVDEQEYTSSGSVGTTGTNGGSNANTIANSFVFPQEVRENTGVFDNTSGNVEKSAWQDVRLLVYAGVGVFVLLALFMFLLFALLRRR